MIPSTFWVSTQFSRTFSRSKSKCVISIKYKVISSHTFHFKLVHSAVEFFRRMSDFFVIVTVYFTYLQFCSLQDSSDLRLIVDGKVFYAHQNILKMRSNYFNVLITRWLEENKRCVRKRQLVTAHHLLKIEMTKWFILAYFSTIL